MRELAYFQKIDPEVPDEWQHRICGIACVYMIVNSFEGSQISFTELHQFGLNGGAYVEGVGWQHDGLVEMLEHFGVRAHCEEFRESDRLEEGIDRLRESLERGLPVIISVRPGFDENKDSHMIVLQGVCEDGFIYNDSNSLGEPKRDMVVSTNKLREYWRRLSIFVDAMDTK